MAIYFLRFFLGMFHFDDLKGLSGCLCTKSICSGRKFVRLKRYEYCHLFFLLSKSENYRLIDVQFGVAPSIPADVGLLL